MAVVVLGSINMDLVVRTPRLPVAGETLSGRTFFAAPGGKGANQAVACARLGSQTRMVGRVGGDVFGGALLSSLQDNGVDISGVQTDAGQPSGVAVIVVDDAAENSIIIVAGANGVVESADLSRLSDRLSDARVVLLQLEIPIESVVAAARAARAHGVQIILDPAPARPLPDDLYGLTDVITPNETEAELLVGFPVHDEQEAGRAAEALRRRGAKRIIIKMGARGAYVLDGERRGLVPAFKVQAVDTVAAGDAFNGALGAALDEGIGFSEAVRWGAAAGALSVTKPGAQPSMPDRDALMRMLSQGG